MKSAILIESKKPLVVEDIDLPSKLDKYEVFFVLLISIIICLIATTLPAIRSTKIDPINSLKND